MLEIRPNCECCDADLAPASIDAFICSFECTFCCECTEALDRRCPNCGGELVPRPRRPEEKLTHSPASTVRVQRAEGCAHLVPSA